MFSFFKKTKDNTALPNLASTPPSEDVPEVIAQTAPVPVEVAQSESESKPDSEPESEPESELENVQKSSWFSRLRAGLSRTREQINSLGNVFSHRKIDEELLEDLEATLLMADCGVEATHTLIAALRRSWKQDKLETGEQLQAALANLVEKLLMPLEQTLDTSTHKPFIIMLAGVNGAGKTTSIGKLAHYFQAQGKSVLLAAGDTFRAAAREQLQEWGERNNVKVISQDGGDPAAVIFDAIAAARARDIDIVLADTAGRLPTQLNLMEEIAKVRRVIQKADPTGPHEVLLVLDANIGQNALSQLKAFDAAIGVTGLIVTKLDGTAKGGVIAAIARTHPKALRFVGVGEQLADLQPFNAKEFTDALFRANDQ